MMNNLFRELGRVESWVRACAVITAGLAIAALLGWCSGVLWLGSLGWGVIPMAPSTALSLLLCSASLYLGVLDAARPWARRAGMAIAATAAAVGS